MVTSTSLTLLLIRFGVGFSFLDHAVDILIRQTARGLDADLLFLAGALSLADTLTMPLASMSNVDLDLRHAARRRRDADQVELAQHLVVRRHFALALEHADRHRVLVVLGGGEGLRFLVGIVVLRSISG